MLLRCIPVLLVGALLVGCDSGGDVDSFGNARAFAKAFGCSDVHGVSAAHRGPFVGDAVDCTYEDSVVTVSWFEDVDERAKYVHAARTFGVEDVFVQANLTVLCLESPRPCDALERRS